MKPPTGAAESATPATKSASDKPVRSIAWQLLRIVLLGTLIGILLFAVYVGIALFGV